MTRCCQTENTKTYYYYHTYHVAANIPQVIQNLIHICGRVKESYSQTCRKMTIHTDNL